MEKKREGDRKAAGEVFLSSDPLYHCFFGIGDEKGELLKLLFTYTCHAETTINHWITAYFARICRWSR
jgi:hypothetical protein